MNKPLLFLLVLWLLGCSANRNAEENKAAILPSNPIISGEFPDPSVIEVDGVFYACGTSNDWAPLYPIYSSVDLMHWELVSYVFPEAPSWTSAGFWAPELFYRNGTFFCYYTAKDKSGVSRIGVATSTSIAAGFEDNGPIISWGKESIDAFVNVVDDQLYISWKAYGLDADKPIQILGSRLSANGLALEGEVFPILTADANNWERGGIEGQSIIQKNDFLYLFYSGAACCGGECDYKLGVARSRTMLGPWEKFPENPIMSDYGSWKCPGHGTPIAHEEQWYYIYHAYPSEGFPFMGRAALIDPFYWDDQSSWPYFKAKEGDSSASPYSPLDFHDSFEGDHLKKEWRWNGTEYSPQMEISKGRLQLSALDAAPTSPVVLAIIPENPSYQISVTLPTQGESFKGLCLYGTASNNLGLGLKSGNLVVYQVLQGDYQNIPLSDNYVLEGASTELRIQVEMGHIAEFYLKTNHGWTSLKHPSGDVIRIKGDFLEFWQWGVKPGLFVQGSGVAEFYDFSLSYTPSSEPAH